MCGFCQEITPKSKRLSMVATPPRLLVHLIRTKTEGRGESYKVSKIEKPIIPSPSIELGCQGTMYLYGFIIHSGSKDKGHYVTIRRKGLLWYEINDRRVRAISSEEALKDGRGVLFLYKSVPPDLECSNSKKV